VGQERGDALAVENAEFDRAGADGFKPTNVEAAVGAQDAEAGAKPLLGMRPAGGHG
jgi:hypothetical protein